jgi:hypothetical protein
MDFNDKDYQTTDREINIFLSFLINKDGKGGSGNGKKYIFLSSLPPVPHYTYYPINKEESKILLYLGL